jgi:hypothetical protein
VCPKDKSDTSDCDSKDNVEAWWRADCGATARQEVEDWIGTDFQDFSALANVDAVMADAIGGELLTFIGPPEEG